MTYQPNQGHLEVRMGTPDDLELLDQWTPLKGPLHRPEREEPKGKCRT